MNDINEVVNKATEQVYEQVRFIKTHNKTLGISLSIDLLGAPDPYLERMKREEAIDNASEAVEPGAPDTFSEWMKREEAIDNASEAAKKAILKPSILKYICPALSSVTGDVFGISKILVGVLVPLSIAGTITITWSPLVIAAGAFLIARAGITSICKDVDIKQSKK